MKWIQIACDADRTDNHFREVFTLENAIEDFEKTQGTFYTGGEHE